MELKHLNPFVPPQPESTRAFMESVQPLAPPVHQQLIDTAKQVYKALAGTAVTVATSPLAIAEAGSYAAANVLALPSVVINKIGRFISAGRTKIYNTVMGFAG